MFMLICFPVHFMFLCLISVWFLFFFCSKEMLDRCRLNALTTMSSCSLQEERSKVDDLRGTPMSVGTLEEIIDDNHAIVSTSVGSEHYVSILSFVDKDLLEPGCSVLLNHKVIWLSIMWCTVKVTLLPYEQP